MMRWRKRPLHLPPVLAFVATYLSAAVAAFIDVRLAAIPLSLFVVLCFTAPFFPGLSFYLPVISRGVSGKRAVALTFDDGPDPLITPALLDTLKRHRVNATFFVTGRRAAANRDLVVQILSAGHSIGNHSYHHFPLLMLKSRARLQDEILSAQSLLSEFGISPLSFRPPVGITSPRLGQVLQDAGLICVNFSCRGYDAGNRFIERLSINILKKVKPDDIILLHDSAPSANFNLNKFLHEIEIILTGLREKKLEVLPLSELIGKDIMKDCS